MMELIVIAAGKGSRFTKAGIYQPKPLVLFEGKPLFWWATESAISGGDFSQIHFAILREHINFYDIDKEILAFYPHALLHIIEEITSGAAETAALVSARLAPSIPVAFVDCDLAFSYAKEGSFIPLLKHEYCASLCLFNSDNPAFSYAIFNSKNEISGTVEKMVASDWAICGIYAFKSADFYLQHYLEYQKNCTYNELFLSGVINNIVKEGGLILPIFLSEHLSLGTPSDIKEAMKDPKHNLPYWQFK
jgi:dTDP-glucose pyrophosphorylase